MKINSCDNKTNFGWRYPTHGSVTSLIADEFPKLQKYKQTLTKFVVKPDFDERGFKGNNHFYFQSELFRPRESFMDFTGRNNALSKYEEHMYNFDRFVNKNNEKAMENAGRALHFLQDMTQPQHVQRGNIFQKWRDLAVHTKFEEFEHEYHDYFVKNSQNVLLDVKKGDYSDLFDEAVFLSENATPASKLNSDMWVYMAQDGISNMIAVTKEFCRNISKDLY